MKKFTIPCDFNGQQAPFTVYIGMPKDDHHPLHFQADWLTKVRGGTIPQEVMESLTRLKEISVKNGVSFEDLCVYALGSAQQEEAEQKNADEDESEDAEEEEKEPEAEAKAEEDSEAPETTEKPPQS